MKYHAMSLISGKHYCKKNLKFDFIEPNAFKDIFEKTDARVVGYIHLKETKGDTGDTMIIASNNQTYQYKIEHGPLSHIMGYILVSNDTYIAVKKDNFLWPVIFWIIIAFVVFVFLFWKILL